MRFKLLQKNPYPLKNSSKQSFVFNKTSQNNPLSASVVSPNKTNIMSPIPGQNHFIPQPLNESVKNVKHTPIKLKFSKKDRPVSPEEIETTPSVSPTDHNYNNNSNNSVTTSKIIQSYRSLKTLMNQTKISDKPCIPALFTMHGRSNSANFPLQNQKTGISSLMRDKTLNGLLNTSLRGSQSTYGHKSFYSVDNNRTNNNINYSNASMNKSYISVSLNKGINPSIYPVDFYELLTLEDKLNNILIKLTNGQPPLAECYDYWNAYYESTLTNNYQNLFNDSNNVRLFDDFIHLESLCLLICMDISSSNDKYIKVNIILKSIFSLIHFNFLIISKYILVKYNTGDSSSQKLNVIIRSLLTNNLTNKDMNEYYLMELLKHNYKNISTFYQSILENFYINGQSLNNTSLNNTLNNTTMNLMNTTGQVSICFSNGEDDLNNTGTGFNLGNKRSVVASFFTDAYRNPTKYTLADFDRFLRYYLDFNSSRSMITSPQVINNESLSPPRTTQNSTSLLSLNENGNYVMLYSSSPMYYLPPIESQYEYSLILDLDETLIHVKLDKEENGRAKLIFRPFLFDFLSKMKKIYEIVLFTVSLPEYANKMVSYIERKEKYFNYKLFRQHVSKINGEYVKDLSKLGRDMKKIIIVDNMPQNFVLQKENGICIKAFYGDSIGDNNTLCELGHILERIRFDGSGDVRQSLRKYRERIRIKISNDI